MSDKEKFVRTKTRASGGITPEEKIKLVEHSAMWRNRIFRTESANKDFPKLKAAIEGIYAAANLDKPIVILVPSPVCMSYAFGAAAAIWDNRANKKPNLDISAGYAGETNPTMDAIILATQEGKNPQSGSVVYNRALADPIKFAREACVKAAGQFGLECTKRWNNVVQGGAYSAYDDSYITALRDAIGLDLPIFEKYKHWEQAAIYGTFRVLHEKFCIVADFPEVLKIDDENRAHGEDGPSHRWRDGWELYHWHGTRVPNEWIKDKKSLSAKTALTWKNIEQRRAACEILGWATILKELNAVTIDKDADEEIGELVEVDLPDSGKEKFLRARCGTGREFAMPVPPEMKTAMEANAWSYGWTLDEFKVPEVRT